MPSSRLILWHPLLLLPSIFPSIRTFPVSHLFTSGDQNTRASDPASILPVNIQDWSPLRLTSLISLLSKGLSGVFLRTTVRRHQFFGVLPSLWSSSHNHMWTTGKTVALAIRTLAAESCLCFSTHCLGFSSLSCQEAIVFWFHGCSHHPQSLVCCVKFLPYGLAKGRGSLWAIVKTHDWPHLSSQSFNHVFIPDD